MTPSGVCLCLLAALFAFAGVALADDPPPGPPVVLAATVAPRVTAVTSQPADEPAETPRTGRANPFGPPVRPFAASRPDAAGPATATSAANQPPICLPTLEGLTICGEAVFACFRCNGASVVVEPGATIGAGPAAFVFVAAGADEVTLRDPTGQLHRLRVSVRTGPTPPPTNPVRPVSPTPPSDLD